MYVLNTGFYRSVDGGRSFPQSISVPHGDNHDLWINPSDPENMINANDGGANVSFDGRQVLVVADEPTHPLRCTACSWTTSGRTGSMARNKTTARSRCPPQALSGGTGCLQTGMTWAAASRATLRLTRATRTSTMPAVTAARFPTPTARPANSARSSPTRSSSSARRRVISSTAFSGTRRFDSRRTIRMCSTTRPRWSIGARQRAELGGHLAGPDHDNEEQQDFTGGPISHDSTGVEVYNTIFSLEESVHRKGELWSGSDDGRLHVSRDNGSTWDEVTPKGLPEGATINNIDISAHDPTGFTSRPIVTERTTLDRTCTRANNGGKSWKSLADGENGIPATNFARVVREDPVRKGLLFVGTEFGLYASFDDGKHWQRLENELPVSPVTDLLVHRDDLVIATQGRAFWVLDDITPMRQMTDEVRGANMWLFQPKDALRGAAFRAGRNFASWSKNYPRKTRSSSRS